MCSSGLAAVAGAPTALSPRARCLFTPMVHRSLLAPAGMASLSSNPDNKNKFDINKDVFDPLKRPKRHPYITGNARYMPGFSFPAPRELESIVKYALLERESPEEIKMIWTTFHNDRKDCVASVVGKATYQGFRERSAKCPNFVYPVRRENGTFFCLFAQWQGRHCIFTHLDDYRRNPTLAEPYFAVTMFDDLLDRKGLVLVRGDFAWQLTKEDGQKLLAMIEQFYLVEPSFVETFNKRPQEFDFQRYMESCP